MDEALGLLKDIGIEASSSEISSRRLKIKTNRLSIDLLVVRATDVPTYVDHGAADIGITGKDILLESETDGYYEPLDLQISKCRLCAAGLGKTRPALKIKSCDKIPKSCE